MQVITGITPTVPKIMVHGLSGAGKSSLGAKLKNPIFLDLEGGVNYIDVPRTPQITSYDTFYTYLVELYRQAEKKREYDFIVIDTVDWLVRKLIEKAAGIDKNNLTETLNHSNGGWGNGKQVLENEVRTKLLPMLVTLNKQGYGICLLAHSDRKHVMNAEGFDETRITPKIDANTMNIFVEWCDDVFYLKNVNGERILVLEGDGNVLAKNRLGLTGEVSLSETDINELLMPKTEAKKEKMND